MIQIFQIGNVPIHIHQARHPYDNQVEGKDLRLAQSPKILLSNAQYNLRQRSITIEGVLMMGCNQTPDNLWNAFSALLGVPTDVIGYVLTGCCGAGDCACDVVGDCEPLWLHNRGKLTALRYDPKGSPESIRLTITFETFWKGLDVGIWEYTSRPPLPWSIETVLPPYDLAMRELPGCDMLYHKNNCYAWAKRYYDVDTYHYDVDYMSALYAARRLGYPSIGSIVPWSGVEDKYQINVDSAYWNAPPLSVYQLRNMAGSSLAYLTIKRVTDVWQPRNDLCVINIATLKTRLLAAGYSALVDSDRLVIGDVFPAPGFILRGNLKISDVDLPITYIGDWPGILSMGVNEVRIETDGNAESAQFHSFRRL